MTDRREYTPRVFAAKAIGHLAEHDRCALWAKMGMGKTVLTLSFLDSLLNVMGESDPVLILGPKRVAGRGWGTEASKWDHLRDLTVTAGVGTVEQRKAALRRIDKGQAQVLAVNYENVPWLREQYPGNSWPFRTVVPDEARKLHGFRLKQGTQRAQVLAEIAHTQVKRWVNLTGAPAPNGLKDLWGQTWFLDAGKRLGLSYDDFESRWFGYRRVRDAINKREHIQTIIFPHSQREIMDKLKDICLTLDPKDYYDIKDPVVVEVPVELEPSARKHYRQMERELFTDLGNGVEVEAFSAASKSSKCLQAANGAMYLDAERYGAGQWAEFSYAKLDALESVLNEAGGEPVIVSYAWRHDLARLKRAFPEGVNLAERAGFEAFMSGAATLGFAHPGSLGHGVDGLQDVCCTMVFFGNDWDLDEHDQMVERIGPMRQMQAGFDRAVLLYYLVAEGTIDEAVRERLSTKRDVQAILLEYMKRKENHV